MKQIRVYRLGLRADVILLTCIGVFLGITLKISLLEASSRFPTREQDVQFENGKVRLAGTLVLPDAPGPHPAMVIVHGSGAADRHNWEEHTKHFPSLGVALLKFDKRGVGESAGNWLTASMPTLADDVLAGVTYLQHRSDIDPKQVGVWGGSQGWTVGSLAVTNATKNSILFARNFKKVFAGTVSKFLSIMGVTSFHNRQRLF